MRLKPLTNIEDFKTIIINGDLRNKTWNQIEEILRLKNISEDDIEKLYVFCNENRISFNEENALKTNAEKKYFGEKKKMNAKDTWADYCNRIKQYELLTAEEERTYGINIQKGLQAKTIKENAKSFPYYSLKFEDYLDSVIQNGKISLDALTQANLRLVVSIARKHYKGPSVSLELIDLVQEGNLGLINAAQKYDPGKGRFATYASWWISQKIQRAIINKGESIRLPVHLAEKRSKMRYIDEEYQQKYGRSPTNEEYAKKLKLKISDVERIKKLQNNTESLDKEIASAGSKNRTTTVSDMVATDSNSDPTRVYDQTALRETISSILDTMELTPVERRIVDYRFGIEQMPKISVKQISINESLDEAFIRKVESRALEQFRKPRNMKLLASYM